MKNWIIFHCVKPRYYCFVSVVVFRLKEISSPIQFLGYIFCIRKNLVEKKMLTQKLMVLGKEILVQRKNVGEEMRFENFNLSKKKLQKNLD